MRVPFQEYTFESFIQNLIALDFKVTQGFKVITFLTSFDSWMEDAPRPRLLRIFQENGFVTENMGEIYRLSASYYNRELRKRMIANFYAYHNSRTRILLCFTEEKTDAIDQTLGQVAETSTGIYFMFISPNIFDGIRSQILDEFPTANCFYFSAKHIAKFARKGETRPFINRTIIYHGEDALQTLDEVQQFYGASPRIMRYKIPDFGNYEIKSNGYFTLMNMERPGPAIKYLLKLVELTSLNILLARKIIESSDFMLIPIRTEKKTFKIPKLIPWAIKFGKKLDINDANSLMESLVGSGYTIFNYVLAEGSLRLNGLVLDEKKLKIFTIDLDDERMIIAPREKTSFDVFLRFYAELVDNFDPQAKVEEFK